MTEALRPNLFQHSLKTRVTIFTLTIFLVSIWSVGSYASLMLRSDLQRQIGEQQLSSVSFIAAEINDELVERLKILEEVASNVPPAVLTNRSTLQRFLNEREYLQRPFNAGVIVYGVNGTAMSEIPPLASGLARSVEGRVLLGATLDDGRLSVRHLPSRETGQSPLLIEAAPIRDAEGRIVATLVGINNLDKPNFLDIVFENRLGNTGGYLLISPLDRQIIAATDRSKTADTIAGVGSNLELDRFIQGNEGSEIGKDTRGMEVLVSSKSVAVAGWVMSAVLPTQEAFAAVHDTQHRVLLATILFTLAAAVLTWWMLRRELLPMVVAARTLTLRSDADKDQQLLPIARHDEIGALIGGFNRALSALKESEDRYKTLVEWSPEAVAVHRNGILLYVNPAMLDMLGAKSGSDLVGKQILDLVHSDYREMVLARVTRSADERAPQPMIEAKFRRLDDTSIDVEVQSISVNYGGEPAIQVAMRDVTERNKSDSQIRLAASVFTHAREGIMITDADGTIVDVNTAFTSITGYDREDVIDNNPRLLSSGRQSNEFYEGMWHDLIVNGHWYGEVWNRRKNGEIYVQRQNIAAVHDDKRNIVRFISLISDISELKAQQRQLEHLAHFDPLTGLPNRVLLSDRLRQAMARSKRSGRILTIALLDLDGFKAVNDTYGHGAGDQLLTTVANRMKQVMRDGDTMARIGGDEFVAVLDDLSSVTRSEPLLIRLMTAVAQPFQFGSATLQVSASIGVTFYPQTEDFDADQLLRQADQGMYQAKLEGKNRYNFFDPAQDRAVRGHHESLEAIRHALSERQFVLHYQPKVNMRTGEVIGAEALIRWQHPKRGLLMPSAFLPAIESHSLAVDVGEWVINSALNQMEVWRAAGIDISVSVNIGSYQLQQADFVDHLKRILAAHPRVSSSRLELEILETSALNDMAHVSQVIQGSRELGVSFALDDFGTGYSSLGYLKHLPVQVLKIDQSFVLGMLNKLEDQAILKAVLGLATTFKLQVIAEGVETVAHGTLLLQMGCELAQGYGIAPPMPADDLPVWVAAWQPGAAWQATSTSKHNGEQ
jgi:diguanylate cyclase (GGDEF)-like protein/PAS domain S-box-containing protein